MNLITEESWKRPEVVRWHERILEYEPPEWAKVTVLLPCSAKKPYSRSRSHTQFRKYIKRGAGEKLNLVHEIILTSPLGIIPRELENLYPAAHYDIPVTGHWKTEEKEILRKLLSSYFKKIETKRIAHVDGVYREISKEVNCILTKENILSVESLEDLQKKINENLKDFKPAKIDTKVEKIKRICDFQFGKGASETLIKSGTKIKGNQVLSKGKQIAAINPKNGLLSLTLKGGEMLKEYEKNIVELSFKPETKSIFSIGVVKAGGEIRPHSEVIAVYRDKVVGVGRSMLNGREMVESRKGLAVELRHLSH